MFGCFTEPIMDCQAVGEVANAQKPNTCEHDGGLLFFGLLEQV